MKVIHGLVRGTPPMLDLQRERAIQRLLVEGAAADLFRSAQDCAEGGLAVAAAECCFETGLGVTLDLTGVGNATGFVEVFTLFGESASRIIVSADADRVDELLSRAARAGVPAAVVGRVGGYRLTVAIDGRIAIDESISDLERLWSTAIGRFFEATEYPQAVA